VRLKRRVCFIWTGQAIVPTEFIITMLLHQVALRQGVPFDVNIPNAETQRKTRDLR